jgi:hypothetical protein
MEASVISLSWGKDRVPIIRIFFFQKRDISIFSLNPGTFGKKGHDKKIKNKRFIIHYMLNIEKFKRTKMSSKLLF